MTAQHGGHPSHFVQIKRVTAHQNMSPNVCIFANMLKKSSRGVTKKIFRRELFGTLGQMLTSPQKAWIRSLLKCWLGLVDTDRYHKQVNWYSSF